MKRKVSIHQKADKFVVDYRDFDNKRHRLKFAKRSEAEAERKAIDARLNKMIIASNMDAPKIVITPTPIKEAIKDFVELTGRDVSIHYKRTEKWHFELFFEFACVLNSFHFMHEITELTIDGFISHLRKNSFAGSTINRVIATLKPFFKKTVKWGFLAKNPTLEIEKLNEPIVPIRALTLEQKKAVREKLHSKVLLPIYFIGVTGCRPIDCCRTNCGDIDFERNTVRFTNYKGGKLSETYSPMSDELARVLKEHIHALRRDFKAREMDPVFTNFNGTRWRTDILSKWFRKALKEAGITNKSLYGLRHSFCTDLVDLGVHSRDIQELARHKKVETTVRYTKRNVDHLRDVVNRLGDTQKAALEA